MKHLKLEGTKDTGHDMICTSHGTKRELATMSYPSQGWAPKATSELQGSEGEMVNAQVHSAKHAPVTVGIQHGMQYSFQSGSSLNSS